MTGRRILAALFLLPALAAGYMTWMMVRAGDDGKWMFGVFTVFFILLGISPLLPELKPRKKPEPTPNTRFVPHWFMLLAILVVVVGIILAIIDAVRAILE